MHWLGWLHWSLCRWTCVIWGLKCVCGRREALTLSSSISVRWHKSQGIFKLSYWTIPNRWVPEILVQRNQRLKADLLMRTLKTPTKTGELSSVLVWTLLPYMSRRKPCELITSDKKSDKNLEICRTLHIWIYIYIHENEPHRHCRLYHGVSLLIEAPPIH